MAKKGSLGVQQLILGIGALMIVFIAMLVVTNALGGTGFVSDWFEKLFGQGQGEDLGIAIDSMDALTCAINSVALDSDQCSSKSFGLSSVSCGQICCSYLEGTNTESKWLNYEECKLKNEGKSVSDTGPCGPIDEGVICCQKEIDETFYEWVSSPNQCDDIVREKRSGGGPMDDGHPDEIKCKNAPGTGGICCEIERGNEYKWATQCTGEYKFMNDNVCISTIGQKTVPTNLECKIGKFQLPQPISEAEDWLAFMGDPEYLAYWQNFPAEEDTWTFEPGWKLYTFIAIISIIPPFKAGKIVTATVMKKTLGTFFERLVVKVTGKEALERIVTKSVTESMIRKSARDAVKDMIKRNVIKKEAGDKILQNLGKADVKVAVQKANDNMKKELAKDVTKTTEVTNKYAEETLHSTLQDAGMFDATVRSGFFEISEEAVNKLQKKALSTAQRAALKQMNALGLREQFLELIEKRLIGRDLPKTLLKFGTLSGVVRTIAIADNMTQARFEPIPSEIVLKPALLEPIVFEISNNWKEKPVLISTINTKRVFGAGPMLIDEERPFHLVSPCYLDTLNIEKTIVECPQYVISDQDGKTLVECVSKGQSGNSGIDLEIEDNFGDTVCDARTYDTMDFGPLEFFDNNLQKIPDVAAINKNDNEYLIPIKNDLVFHYNEKEPEKSKAVLWENNYVSITPNKLEYPVIMISDEEMEVPGIDYIERVRSIVLETGTDAPYQVETNPNERISMYFVIEDPKYEEIQVIISSYDESKNPGKSIQTVMHLIEGSFSSPTGTIILSDEGDDGTVHTIDVSKQGVSNAHNRYAMKGKTMTDSNFDRPGFEYIRLDDCRTETILVEMGSKTQGYDDNYCTSGASTTDAWIEWGADVAMVGGIVVGTMVGGAGGFAIIGITGLTQVAVDPDAIDVLDIPGDWPDSQWS
ncbi:MAG: hypothetical protein ABIJ92_05290 [Candidatus Aenigmatarchaeota archaeon]